MTRLRFALAAGAAFWTAAAVAGQDVAGTRTGQAGAAETVGAIAAEFTKARADWFAAYRKVTGKEERRKLMATYPKPDAYRKRVWTLVDPAPDSEEAGAGLVWVVQNGARAAELDKALGILEEHHLARPDLDRACGVLAYQLGNPVLSFLRAAHAKAGDTKTKGIALYCLAKVLQRRAAAARRLAADPAVEKSYTSYYGADLVASLRKAEPDALAGQAEKELETCAAEFADVPFQGRTLGQKATSDLFELRNLAVGKVAPDISGEDVDGAAFKISDYRGKVVMLDFWGDW